MDDICLRHEYFRGVIPIRAYGTMLTGYMIISNLFETAVHVSHTDGLSTNLGSDLR